MHTKTLLLIQIYNVMKKIFTLISMALVAMSVNAQTHEPGLYPVKSVTWKAISWKNNNNKKDKDNNDLLYLMGTGNGYATLLADYYYSEEQGDYFTRAEYTYIDYEKGETGIPAYGLYYQFSPKADGNLKVSVWVNKGGDNRKTFVVKASDGKPLTPFVDYTFDGYVNGQNEDGHPKYFSAEAFKARHDEVYASSPQPYKLSESGQAVWGWITFDVKAGESYVVYQQSSQLGFGGYDFTPTGGEKESYVACIDMGGEIGKVLSNEFSAVIDASGNATNVTSEGSVVNFGTANMDVKAVGGAEPESVEADFEGTGIVVVKAAEQSTDAPIYNLAGQQVDKSYKGVVIQNGKKMIQK